MSLSIGLAAPVGNRAKARIKQRIRLIAQELIKIAAERKLKPGIAMEPPDGVFDEFAARFPYAETEDQLRAIADVLADMPSGRTMDRLVCGDVGFGKTEVALRAAFGAVMSGNQVAVLMPTTLLALTACALLSATASMPAGEHRPALPVGRPSEITESRKGLANGNMDIVIGTHPCWLNDLLRDLGL